MSLSTLQPRPAGRPAGFCAAMIVFFGALLAVDRVVGLGGQLLLGAATWLVFLYVVRSRPPIQRVQVGLVVVVASSFEVIGSLVWGMYTYRLHNIPMFVPPGHGLVYLTGIRLSETRFVTRRARGFVAAVFALSVVWVIAGLLVPARPDLIGAIGAVGFAAFLLRGRVPAVYAGVFLTVGALELYGTAIGTWAWAGVIPWWRLPQGNPPSGVAGGYVLFDVLAVALTPFAWTLIQAARRSLRGARERRLPGAALARRVLEIGAASRQALRTPVRLAAEAASVPDSPTTTSLRL